MAIHGINTKETIQYMVVVIHQRERAAIKRRL